MGHSQVSADNVLEDGTLAAGLTADDGDLGKVDRVVDTDGREHILQLVDKPMAHVVRRDVDGTNVGGQGLTG